jgi:hypothetical protein
MLVESIIRRKNGTTVKLDDSTYKFQPGKGEPRHLCNVKNQVHLAKFLTITEGYRLANQEDEDELTPDPNDAELTPGKGSLLSTDPDNENFDDDPEDKVTEDKVDEGPGHGNDLGSENVVTDESQGTVVENEVLEKTEDSAGSTEDSIDNTKNNGEAAVKENAEGSADEQKDPPPVKKAVVKKSTPRKRS